MPAKLPHRLHYLFTSIAIKLGPDNPLVRFALRRQCRRFQCELDVTTGRIQLRKGDRALILAPDHFVYAPSISAQFESLFGAILPETQAGLEIVDFSAPRTHTYRDSGLEFVLTSFPEEPEALSAYARYYRASPGHLIFDIGAHCGVSTYHFSRQVGPTGKVIAFEPDPKCFDVLKGNVSRHNLTNVLCVPAAVTRHTGTAAFFSEGSLGSCLSRHSSRATSGTKIQVATISLADAFKRWGTPDFCKLDIEGSEVDVLSSSRDLISSCSTQFVVDTNHKVKGELSYGAVEQAFRSAGLETESSYENGMITWAWPKWAATLKSTA